MTFVCPLLLPLVVVGNGAAMYAMVCIDIDKFDDKIIDDISFMKLLLEEENVVVLPGCAFGLVGDKERNASSSVRFAFRVVFCAPESILNDAAKRISSFCLRHSSL
jgi:tyrosine aminotransferase